MNSLFLMVLAVRVEFIDLIWIIIILIRSRYDKLPSVQI